MFFSIKSPSQNETIDEFIFPRVINTNAPSPLSPIKIIFKNNDTLFLKRYS